MKESEILYGIQEKLIQDLGGIVKDVEQQYGSELNNSWVFEHLGGLLQKLEPASAEGFEYSREDLESKLKGLVDNNLGKVQGHVPEIKTKDLYGLVKVAGNLSELIYNRAQKEVNSLQLREKDYVDVQELIKEEFEKSQAFTSGEEHVKWTGEFSEGLENIFDYLGDVGKILSEKKGVKWKFKLSAAKLYLKSQLGINLSLPDLTEDVKTVKKAILENYINYEIGLANKRYDLSI